MLVFLLFYPINLIAISVNVGHIIIRIHIYQQMKVREERPVENQIETTIY